MLDRKSKMSYILFKNEKEVPISRFGEGGSVGSVNAKLTEVERRGLASLDSGPSGAGKDGE